MILVTGGTGLIGGFLLAELARRGLPVRAIYRNSTVPVVAGATTTQWVPGDIRDGLGLREALGGVSHVFHCAGLVSYAPQDEEELLRVNVEGTANVVDACLERPDIRLGFVSSVAALGGGAAAAAREAASAVPLPIDEKAQWDLGAEHNAYATSKYLAELEVWRGVSEGLRAVIVNPSVVLGPADWHRSSTRLFRYAHNEHHFYTPSSLNLVDVRDVAEMLVQLTLDTDRSGERYVLNAGAWPLAEVLGLMAAGFGKRPPTVAVPGWAAETIWRFEHVRSLLTGARPLITKDTARAGRRALDYRADKIRRELGREFRPLPETIAWCCQALAPAQGT